MVRTLCIITGMKLVVGITLFDEEYERQMIHYDMGFFSLVSNKSTRVDKWCHGRQSVYGNIEQACVSHIILEHYYVLIPQYIGY